MTREEKCLANREAYRLLRAHGLCTACKAEVLPNARTGRPRSKCDPCQDAIIRWGDRHRAQVARSQALYVKDKRRKRKRRGLCTECGTNPRGRTVKCDPCANYHNERYRPGCKAGCARACSLCRQSGHDIRTCTRRPQAYGGLTIDDYATARTFTEVGW